MKYKVGHSCDLGGAFVPKDIIHIIDSTSSCLEGAWVGTILIITLPTRACVILPQRAVNTTLRVNTTHGHSVGDGHCFGILRTYTRNGYEVTRLTF